MSPPKLNGNENLFRINHHEKNEFTAIIILECFYFFTDFAERVRSEFTP